MTACRVEAGCMPAPRCGARGSEGAAGAPQIRSTRRAGYAVMRIGLGLYQHAAIGFTGAPAVLGAAVPFGPTRLNAGKGHRNQRVLREDHGVRWAAHISPELIPRRRSLY